MYPLVRIDKLHPDGSPRAAWLGYRLPDVDGWARVWAPPHTPRAHAQWGGWTPAEPLLTALSTAERFVPTLFWDPDGLTFYNDIVREVRVTEHGFAFIDLYVDVVLHNGVVKIKDEELLERLGGSEATSARERAHLLAARAEQHDPFFDPTIPLWTVPSDAQGLRPGPTITLVAGA
jgi:Protein of unknown function (DUF402)